MVFGVMEYHIPKVINAYKLPKEKSQVSLWQTALKEKSVFLFLRYFAY